VDRGLAVVVRLAQAAAVGGVVRVEVGGDELASAERVVVGDLGQARDADAGAEHTQRVALEHSLAEREVSVAVASGAGSSSGLLGFASVSRAAAAGHELGAAWCGADLERAGHQV
jgi:hypothetical protein